MTDKLPPTAVELALRRMCDADRRGEEYMAEFKTMLRSIVNGVVQVHEKKGLAPEVAILFAEKVVLQMAGIEKGTKLVSPRMMTFAVHQQEWVKYSIKQCIQEIKKERGMA